MQGRSVHQGRWNYVAWDGGAEALFDIQSNPFQMKNLAAEPEHVATLATMKKLMENFPAKP